MKRGTQILLLLAVVALVVLPLRLVKRSGPDAEIFLGADDQAKGIIAEVAPGYQPWAKPLMEPPSGEIGSMLFALQAAAGAGVIGYYLGSRNARARLKQDQTV